ncbi:MAG TPA: hypothetical protein VKR80_00275 [Candidatus Limnocylindria bacterium]|nr:hypothetical protein [Candidatus Limnocylindria bacterium]
MNRKRPDSLILVYDGDSGLRAMLLDVLKKAAGREDCPLCEITYTPLGKRREWKACEARLGLAIRELHRDQLPRDWKIPRDELPCVLLRAGMDKPVVLVDRAAIVACRASVQALERRIREALAQAHGAVTAERSELPS